MSMQQFSRRQKPRASSNLTHKLIVPNNNLCKGCGLCELACSLIHEGSCSPSLSRIHVLKDHERYRFRISVCLQCINPYCMKACPQGAIKVKEEAVIIVEETCTGCGLCVEACPFNSNHHIILRHPSKGVYVKCDLCSSREEGPLCISICPSKALTLKEIKAVKE